MWYIHLDHPIESDHCDLLQQHYTFLLETVDTFHSQLLNQLLSAEVLESAECDDIKSVSYPTRRTELLLSVLGRKSRDQFERFILALEQTGQGHVASTLRPKEPAYDALGNYSTYSMF